MKKLLILTLIVVATVSAKAQVSQMKNKVIAIDTASLTGKIHAIVVQDFGKAYLMIDPIYKKGSSFIIDSLTVYVRKSQIRWVNDSTAIIRKP